MPLPHDAAGPAEYRCVTLIRVMFKNKFMKSGYIEQWVDDTGGFVELCIGIPIYG